MAAPGRRSGALDAASESIYLSRAVFASTALYGHDPFAVAARFGVTRDVLADPDARLPARLAIRIWDEVPGLVGDDLFGIHLAERGSVSTVPVAGYLVRSSATLAEGLTRVLRYQRLIQNVNDVVFELGPAEARLEVVMRGGEPESLRHAVDFSLGLVVKISRELTGRRITPRRARFRYAQPANPAAYRPLFGDDVAFGAPRFELCFDSAALLDPLPTLDPHLGEVLEKHARAQLERVPATTLASNAARAAILEGLRSGAPTLGSVARAVGTTARTLQRRLQAEGTTLAQLLDDVRRDLAQRYLGHPGMSLAEVAYLLGFSDQAAFHRAFVRWHGTPPGAWRRSLAR